MASTTNTGTSVSRLAALHTRRDKDADFNLFCQGTNIPAHSFLLASTSEYFEIALSKDWLEKEKNMDISSQGGDWRAPGKALSKANYLEISQIADLYSNTSLITKFGNFIYEEFGDGDEINWEEMAREP